MGCNFMIGYIMGDTVTWFFLYLDKIIKGPCFVSFFHDLKITLFEVVVCEIVYV